MPFSFLAPAFLAGLALLAVPVIVHLVSRPKDQVVEFPSLMFLEPVRYRTAQRRRIRHWFLLLLRCLALAILAAAFARPVLDRPVTLLAGGFEAGREVTILVDRSYSMAYGDRFERALEAAREAVDALGEEDRATLVFFDDGAAAANRATADRARLRAALDTLNVGAGRTRYAPALKLAESILAGSDLPRREVILISDFQRTGWNAEEAVRLPAGTVLTPVGVADGPTSNRFVTSVSFRREFFSGRERISATARVVNQGAAAVRGLPVTLELDGRQIESSRIDVPANGTATASFAPFTLSRPNTRGTVRAGDDALPHDNAFHFVLSPGADISVLIVERSGAGPEPSLYLRRALEIGEAPSFQAEVARVERLDPAALEGRDVVVLNDAPFPVGAAGRRLRTWVERGGGLVAVAGDRTRGARWTGPGEGLLPGTFGRPVERRERRGGALGYLDYAHPIFEVFRQPRSGDFTPARFYRYLGLEEVEPEGVLARFDDGAVALAERRVGEGRVLAWASTLDASWNDLALQPVFLPFVHQLAKHAAGYAEARAWSTVGDLIDLGVPAAEEEAPRDVVAPDEAETGADSVVSRPMREGASTPVVLTPSGARIPLVGDARLLRFEEQGFYEVRDPREAVARPRTIAVNLDVAESDLAPFEPAELVAVVAPPPMAAQAASAGDVMLDAAERERRQVIWWYLLAGAVILLAAETLLSNRLPQVVR